MLILILTCNILIRLACLEILVGFLNADCRAGMYRCCQRWSTTTRITSHENGPDASVHVMSFSDYFPMFNYLFTQFIKVSLAYRK